MGCKNININLPTDCSPTTFGGVVKIWIASRKSFGRWFYQNTHDFQTAKIINSEKVTEVPSEIICSDVEFTETFNSQERRYEQELNFTYIKHDSDTRDSTESFQVSRGQVIFLMDSNGLVWLIGETNGIRFTSTEMVTENNSYQITCQASEASPIRLLDADYFDSLIDPTCVEVLCSATWDELCSSSWDCLCAPETIWQDSIVLGNWDATSDLDAIAFRNLLRSDNGEIIVSWGDGTETSYPSGISLGNATQHTYSAPGFYEISIRTPDVADLFKISRFEINGTFTGTWDSLDLSSLRVLTELEIINNAEINNSVTFPQSNTESCFVNVHDIVNQTELDLSGFQDINNLELRDCFLNVTSLVLPSTQKPGASLDRVFIYRMTGLPSIDLSVFTGLGDDIRIYASSNTDQVIFPTVDPSVASPITRLQVECGIDGLLDLSGLTNLGGNVGFANQSVTSVTFPVTDLSNSVDITRLQGWRNEIVNLDLSTLYRLGGKINFHGIAGRNFLENVTLPPSGNTVPLEEFWFYGHPNLNYFNIPNSFPTSDGVDIRLEDCAFTTTEVNFFLRDFDDSGWINGSLRIDGTNAAPDGSSGGVDGITAATNLVSKGWTVTTS
jgi:hypothetical protein